MRSLPSRHLRAASLFLIASWAGGPEGASCVLSTACAQQASQPTTTQPSPSGSASAPSRSPAAVASPDDPAPAMPAFGKEALEIVAAAVAKIVGSAVFLQDREVQSVLDVEFGPTDLQGKLIHPIAKATVDREARTVTADVLGVQRTAVFRPGLGCALMLGGVLPDASGLDEAVLRGMKTLASLPWPTGDVGAIAVPGEGIDVAALEAAVDSAFVGHAPPGLPYTRAVLVVHRGKIIAERYGEGFDASTPLHGWSMSKSVTDALIGMRVLDGALATDQPAALPAWIADGGRRARLTVEQLLRMSSGLAWDEDYVAITSDPIRMLFAEADCAAFAGARPVEDAPGTKWEYSSGTTNLLCKVLRETFESDRAYQEFPHKRLFGRIGMRGAVLETDPSGTFVGSSFAYATARDWARFGMLYLQDGVWEGDRLLPEGWVRASTTPTLGAPRGCYGRQWWLNSGDPEDATKRPYPGIPVDAFYASGHEGQTLMVVPSRELVIVRLGCTKNRMTFRDRRFLEAVVTLFEG